MSKREITIALVSAAFGFLANYLSTRIANNQLKKELLAELTALNIAQQQGRTSAGEKIRIEQRKNEIEAQLKILSK